MKKSYRFITVIVALIIIVAACSKGSNGDGGGTPPPPPPPPSPSSCSSTSAKFSADVNPIIQNSCAISGCHGNGSGNGPGALVTFEQIRNAASQIKTAVVNRSMPRGGTLSNAQIQIISCWVDNGALNN
ncbi:MAG TPA: hypothetical protein VFH08_13325 [Chitinophagaceae bacterium]|nr:hypothetical protein [Chitinophagaceae bacterium]